MAHNEGIFRWSPDPTRNEFLTINLGQRLLQVYQATGHAKPGRFEYRKTSSYSDFPSPNTYDWSPIEAGLLAVGTSHGQVHLLRIDDSSNAHLTLPLRVQRPCQSVAFNTTGLLAVGLDRVRNDSCLQIWDIEQRLSGWDPNKPGWDLPTVAIEPRKVEASLPVTSMKFFEDQPQSLVIGIKNQSVRILDLREPSPTVMNFQTRCNNNICIDYADPNYFASSSLDSPGLMVWDRRASSRAEASPMYLESLDSEEVTFGTALKLKRVIQTDKSGTYVRSLRFCRDQRNMLGILSNTGQLQVLRLNKEYIEPRSTNDITESPALLEVNRSYDIEYPYYDEDHKQRPENRIVSFDWLPFGTSELQHRIVTLRGSGAFDVMQMPTSEAGQLSDLIPWIPPHRLDEPYMTLTRFADPEEQKKVLGPLYTSDMKCQLAPYGSERFQSIKAKKLIATTMEKLVLSKIDSVIDFLALKQLHDEKRRRLTIDGKSNSLKEVISSNSDHMARSRAAPKSKKAISSSQLHDRTHYATRVKTRKTKAESQQRDLVMLQRAVDGYLFNAKINKTILADDKWLQDIWEWIFDAELAATADGMVALGVDLSYMGVFTIWNSMLGNKPKSRFLDGISVSLDAAEWERLATSINKRAGHSDFIGIETFWPQHRRLCLAVCGLAKSTPELDKELDALIAEGKLTMAAAFALFEGLPERAIEILKAGGTTLLFVAMALDIKLRSSEEIELDTSVWSKSLEDHPQLEEDPWLRAIYGYITTGDWKAIAEEPSLPLRVRVGVALRHFRDNQLSDWLTKQMEEVIREGDIEGIVLTGITEKMVDILAKYIEKFNDYQTPSLIMSYCYPRYLDDRRCLAWRKVYRSFLQRHKKYILRVKYEQQSTIKSRRRDGTTIIRPWPRQVTIRCLNCDAQAANDLNNTAASTAPPSTATSTGGVDSRSNPLAYSGINAGVCCTRCGSHLGRCAICLEVVGVPRSDRPDLSTDPAVRRMANFPIFCLKCKHVTHMDHSVSWFKRHGECPVPECRCQCEEVRGHGAERF